MTEPIWCKGFKVALDSGFCVVKGIIELVARGVFACALIKKRRYWPKCVKGDKIKEHFNDKEVGDTGAVKQVLDGRPYHTCCMKEPDYVTMTMGTCGAMQEVRDHKSSRKCKKDGVEVSKTLTHIEPISEHFKHRHQVDDNNNCRHDPVSLEMSWATKHWPDRNFAWFLAVSEVNACLAKACANGGSPMPQLEFCQKLAKQMLEHTEGDDEAYASPTLRQFPRSSPARGHEWRKKPFYRGDWNGTTWNIVESRYQQGNCSTPGCKARIRNYCECNPAKNLCRDCHTAHVVEVAQDKQMTMVASSWNHLLG